MTESAAESSLKAFFSRPTPTWLLSALFVASTGLAGGSALWHQNNERRFAELQAQITAYNTRLSVHENELANVSAVVNLMAADVERKVDHSTRQEMRQELKEDIAELRRSMRALRDEFYRTSNPYVQPGAL